VFWKLMLRLHRWLALGLGLWFVLAGLSGAVLVYWRELAPGPGLAAPTQASLPLAVLLKLAAQALPAEADLFRAMPPAQPGAPWRLEALVPRPQGTDRRTSIWLHPETGAILDIEAWGDSWVHTLYDLHDGALFGRLGGTLVGFAGLALALLVTAGGLLWTRHHRLPLREAYRPVAGLRGLRRWRNLHRAAGLWAALPLLVAGLTGATLSFPGATRQALAPLLAAPEAEPEPARPAVPKPRRQSLWLEDAMALAQARFPGHRIAWLDLPPPDGGSYQLALLPLAPGVAAAARVEVDLASGTVLAEPAAPVETARAWFMALHNGQALGLGHRLAVLLLGLLPLGFAVTGLAMYRRRRLPHRRAARSEPRDSVRA
jgi:uncharacterized iron-regulated membrane protein